jgi:hypothetical protein
MKLLGSTAHRIRNAKTVQYGLSKVRPGEKERWKE